MLPARPRESVPAKQQHAHGASHAAGAWNSWLRRLYEDSQKLRSSLEGGGLAERAREVDVPCVWLKSVSLLSVFSALHCPHR
jgi:hypothetical protein